LGDDAKAAAIVADYATAPLSKRERAIAEYVVKLTTTPNGMVEEDVAALRREGLTDSEILDVCQVAAYYNYVNRLAAGLGVELEEYWGEQD
jgi:uncharacterized peroxidase-related enzyme